MAVLIVILFFLIGYFLNKLLRGSDDKIPVIGSKNFISGTIAATRIAWSASTIGATDVIFRLLNGLPHLFPEGITSMWIGMTYYVIVMKPEFAELVLTSHFHRKADFISLITPFFGKGLSIVRDEDHWRYHRKLLTPAFHFTILKQFSAIMQQNANLLIQTLKMKVKDSIPIDLHPLMMETSFDIMCETALGQDWMEEPAVRSRFMHGIEEFGSIFLDRIFQPLMYWDTLFFLTRSGRRCADLAQYARDVSRRAVEIRKQEIITEEAATRANRDPDPVTITEKKPLLDLLISEQIENPDNISMNEIVDEVTTFIAVGHETTGTAMTWAAYLLGRHPEIQEQVHEEIMDLLTSGGDPHRRLSFEEIKCYLPFTEAVLFETLRFFPGPANVTKVMDQDVKLNDDYTIRKGTSVVVDLMALHNDVNHWQQPEKFMPERFLHQRKRHPFSFLPFSAGSRNCIGQKFALLEMKTVIVSLVRAFKMQSLDQMDTVVTVLQPAIKPVSPIRMKFVLRQEIVQ
jgi:cytochrome P450